jgi:hypothetical protein
VELFWEDDEDILYFAGFLYFDEDDEDIHHFAGFHWFIILLGFFILNKI